MRHGFYQKRKFVDLILGENMSENSDLNLSSTNQNMPRSNLIQSAILAWIVAILLSIACGPMLNMCLSMEDYQNSLGVHKMLKNLNISTSSDFGDIKTTTEQFLYYLIGFLACALGLSICLSILTICQEWACKRILYPVVLFLFSAAFIAVTIRSCFLYENLFDGQIDVNTQMDPSKTDNLHSQMISSLEGKYSSDNFTTGTRMSNDWNHLFINYQCCGVNKVVGTTNDFDKTSWCTTKGSCQATASQIPKTCCKGLTEYDYQNAPTNCHSSVSPGEYYDKGCFSVIQKEVLLERVRFHSLTNDILTEGLKVILVMGFSSFLSFFGLCVFAGVCLTEKEKEPGQDNSVNVPVTENTANLPVNNASTSNGHADAGTHPLQPIVHTNRYDTVAENVPEKMYHRF